MSSLFAEFQSNSKSVKRMAVYSPCKRIRHFSTIKQNSFESCKPAIFKIKVIFFWQLCCAPSISVDSGFWARIHNNLWMSHRANLFLFSSNWNLQMKHKNSRVTFSSDQTPNPSFHIVFLVRFLKNYLEYLCNFASRLNKPRRCFRMEGAQTLIFWKSETSRYQKKF